MLVACCKSNDGTTKARRYRFGKQSDRKKFTLYLELEKIQVDGGRNYYPTSLNLASLVLLSKNHEKVLPGTSLFHPEASVEQAKSSKTSSWRPRPLPSSIRPSERTGVMTAPQARWRVPHRQRKSKEVGPQGDRRSRTTSRPPRLAGIPLAGPRSTAAWRKRRRQAGPRGNSLAALTPPLPPPPR